MVFDDDDDDDFYIDTKNIFAVLKTQDEFYPLENSQCSWDLATLLRLLKLSAVPPLSVAEQGIYKEKTDKTIK